MEYRITINGLDARVNVDHGAETVSAYGITFDENARIVTETRAYRSRYSGFCNACIVYDMAADMLTTRRGIEYDDVSDALEPAGLTCMCGN